MQGFAGYLMLQKVMENGSWDIPSSEDKFQDDFVYMDGVLICTL